MTHQPLITQAGFDQLKTDLDQLKNVQRPQIVDRLSLARSMGDLSENSDYQSAKEELSFIDGQISELEELVQNAKVAAPTGLGEIEFGHSVTVKVGTTQAVFRIVGDWEANPAEKKISSSSPLGQALIGKKVGDKVEVDAPAGKIQYTVVEIA